jgi:hypothetical protein
MTELSLKWKQIFDEISLADKHIVGKVNYYNLTSILEDLYVENAELKARVEALENDKNQWCHPESSLASNKTDTQKLELLLNEIKSTAKRKTCYDSLGATGHYHYSDDHDATFDDGDRYGKITFARELLESIGESYD